MVLGGEHHIKGQPMPTMHQYPLMGMKMCHVKTQWEHFPSPQAGATVGPTSRAHSELKGLKPKIEQRIVELPSCLGEEQLPGHPCHRACLESIF